MDLNEDEESLLDVEDDLPDLKYYLGDAYAEVGVTVDRVVGVVVV